MNETVNTDKAYSTFRPSSQSRMSQIQVQVSTSGFLPKVDRKLKIKTIREIYPVRQDYQPFVDFQPDFPLHKLPKMADLPLYQKLKIRKVKRTKAASQQFLNPIVSPSFFSYMPIEKEERILESELLRSPSSYFNSNAIVGFPNVQSSTRNIILLAREQQKNTSFESQNQNEQLVLHNDSYDRLRSKSIQESHVHVSLVGKLQVGV